MSRRSLLLAVTAAVALLFPLGAQATTTSVIISKLTLGTKTVTVEGNVVLAPQPAVVLGTDPTGDAPARGVGQDITKATVALSADAATAVFTLELADMLPVGGVPGILYTWPIAHVLDDGRIEDRGLALEAGRAGLQGTTAGANPVFHLVQDQFGFRTVTALSGTLEGNKVVWSVPAPLIRAVPGSALTVGGSSGGRIIAGPGAAGVASTYDVTDAVDTPTVGRLPGTLRVGLGPGGPEDGLFFIAPAKFKAGGKYRFDLERPTDGGVFKVFVIACVRDLPADGDCVFVSREFTN